ncbi:MULTISPECIES: carboxypeptidase-like regulatory domain-containing protein [unclassified Duganella]|uniref:carboxypeptidase-like regulatory domain-containing protein n=1 Tax=unclassified Duganella TaxID=2636909 RepID=UPI000E357D5D|nr:MULTISPECIES: carboxypeptidase-like regulatory domain-containing protein [unclassified Duganella]RFP14796.1 hypothetical protein D0T23_12405 [Duganella sp. BJB475]RFP31145.1 hypothetical protein D0T21_14785 [Duganella sp. BJB476]
MKILRYTRCAGAALGLTIAAWASAAPTPIISYLQPLGAAAGNLSSITISPDGRYLAFRQDTPTGTASDIYIYDRNTGATTQANLKLGGGIPVNAKCDLPVLSNEALYAVFVCSGLPMGVAGSEVKYAGQSYLVYDRLQNKTELIAQGSANAIIDLTNAIGLSVDGKYAAFRTRRILANGNSSYTLTIRNMASKTSQETAATSANIGQQMVLLNISQNGRYVSYSGRATPGSVIGDLAVFDKVTGVTEVVNVNAAGVHSNGSEAEVAMSADGNFVAFASGATNLVASQTGATRGVFLRDRSSGKLELISGTAVATYGGVSLSANGRYVSYFSNSNLCVYDRLTKKTRSAPAAYSVGTRVSADNRYVVSQVNQMPGGPGRAIMLIDFGARPGLNLSASGLSLTEGGIAGTYTAVLAQVPDADVNVALSADMQLVLARPQLTFTPDNWNQPQVVSVQAPNDGIAQGPRSGAVTNTVSSSDVEYTVIKPAKVTVAINDAVVPTIVVPAPAWNHSDLPLTGTAAPGATVMLTATNQSTGWLTSVSTVADAQGHWSYVLTGLTSGTHELDVQADGIHGVPQTVTVAL